MSIISKKRSNPLKKEYIKRRRAYQTALKGRGYYDAGIDGSWGTKSRAAAKAFQKDQGIDVNGIMNAETVLRLFGLEG